MPCASGLRAKIEKYLSHETQYTPSVPSETTKNLLNLLADLDDAVRHVLAEKLSTIAPWIVASQEDNFGALPIVFLVP